MIYYGFSETTKQCIFTSSGAVASQEGVVVISSEESYEINEITYGVDGDTPVILPRIATAEELLAQAEAKKALALDLSSRQISILTDVVELGNDPLAEYRLTEWRKYRVKVYAVDCSIPEWPSQPEL